MSRALVALACRTGITPTQWLAEGDEAIDTALQLLSEQDQ